MPTFSPTSARSAAEASRAEDGDAGMQLEADAHARRRVSAHVERSRQYGPTSSRELPRPERLVVAARSSRRRRHRWRRRSRPPGQPLMVTTRSTPSSDGELDRAAHGACASRARGRVGVEQVAGGVHAGERRRRARAARPAGGRARRARRAASARSRCGRGDQVPTPISTSWMPRSAHHAIASRRSRCASPSVKRPTPCTPCPAVSGTFQRRGD